jgi:hypothetical protein
MEMYLDVNQNQVYNLVADMQNRVEMETRASLIAILGAKLCKDGNQWCWLYGSLPNDCIVGFGDTPAKAADAFWINYYNEKP